MSETVPARINSALGGSSRVGNIITLSALFGVVGFQALDIPCADVNAHCRPEIGVLERLTEQLELDGGAHDLKERHVDASA